MNCTKRGDNHDAVHSNAEMYQNAQMKILIQMCYDWAVRVIAVSRFVLNKPLFLRYGDNSTYVRKSPVPLPT